MPIDPSSIVGKLYLAGELTEDEGVVFRGMIIKYVVIGEAPESLHMAISTSDLCDGFCEPLHQPNLMGGSLIIRQHVRWH